MISTSGCTHLFSFSYLGANEVLWWLYGYFGSYGTIILILSVIYLKVLNIHLPVYYLNSCNWRSALVPLFPLKFVTRQR